MLEVPKEGYLNVGNWGGRCSARVSMSEGKKGERTIYDLADGKAVVQKEPPTPQKRPKREPLPEVLIDDTSALATQEATVYWRFAEDKPEKEDPNASTSAGRSRRTRAIPASRASPGQTSARIRG